MSKAQSRRRGCSHVENRAGIDGEPESAATAGRPRSHRPSAAQRKRRRAAAYIPSRPASYRFSGCEEGAEGLPLRCAEWGIRRHVLCLLSGSVFRGDAASHARIWYAGESLVLADLTGGGLARLHCDGSISTVGRYAMPRRWALALWKHPRQVDGIRYVSRFVNSHFAVVLFDRCKDRLTARCTQRLADHSDLPRILDLFNVGI
jgi:hypothetical protein